MAAEDSLSNQFEPLTQLPQDPNPPQGMWARGPKSSSEWSTHAKVRKVPISSLYATQDYVEPHVLDIYRQGGKTYGARRLPRVANEGGKNFLTDGHHRTIVAKERGDTHIRARVWTEDDD